MTMHMRGTFGVCDLAAWWLLAVVGAVRCGDFLSFEFVKVNEKA